jgi:hypothetical protein
MARATLLRALTSTHRLIEWTTGGIGQAPAVASKIRKKCDVPTDVRVTTKKMTEFGKLLIFVGLLLAAAGLILLLLGRTSLPIGRLPGDFLYHGKKTTIYFPLATSLILSVILSIALYLLSRFRR